VPRDYTNGNEEERPKRKRKGAQTQDDGYAADIPFRDADPETTEIPLAELDNFVIPGGDDRGASEHMHLRVPPILRRQIKIILASGRFPYLTEAAFIRHACVRHLYWLVSLRDSIPKHILPTLAAHLEVCREDEMRIQIERVFNKIDERISFHLSRGDHSEVIRLLNLVKNRMQGVQTSVWQRQFWSHFNLKWAGYLSPATQGAGLH